MLNETLLRCLEHHSSMRPGLVLAYARLPTLPTLDESYAAHISAGLVVDTWGDAVSFGDALSDLDEDWAARMEWA